MKLEQVASHQRIQYGTNGLPLTFAWTADRLPPNGCKDTTRRQWSDARIKTFRGYADQRRVIPAWDNSPRVKTSKQIGWARIDRVEFDCLYWLTPDEVRREGYPDLSVLEFTERFFKGCDPDQPLAVIRFTFEPLSQWKQLELWGA